MNQILDIFTIATPQQTANVQLPPTPTTDVGLFASLLGEVVQAQTGAPMELLAGLPMVNIAPTSAQPQIVSAPMKDESETNGLVAQPQPQPQSAATPVDMNLPSLTQDELAARLIALFSFAESTPRALNQVVPTSKALTTTVSGAEPVGPTLPFLLPEQRQTPVVANLSGIGAQIPRVLTEQPNEPAIVAASSRPTLPTTIAFVDTPLATIDKLTALLANPSRTDAVASIIIEPPIITPDSFKAGAPPITASSDANRANLKSNISALKIDHLSGQLHYDVRISELHNKTVVRPEVSASPTERHISGSGLVDRAALPLAVVPPRVVNLAVRQPQSSQPTLRGQDVIAQDYGVAMEKTAEQPLFRPVSQSGNSATIADSSEALILTKDQSPTSGLIESPTTLPKNSFDAKLSELHTQRVELPEPVKLQTSIKRLHIEALLKRGEIKIQLQPEHLGALKIKLISTPTEMSARLETSSDDARRAVELSLPQLRESFERAGLKLNHIEIISTNDNLARQSQEFARNLKQPRKPQTMKVAAGVAATPIVSASTTGGGIGNRLGLNLLA